jgi:acetyltransferase-like isoleucine patch superfamily enzyme
MFKRIKWLWTCDRIGPDIPLTHFLLHFPPLARWLARKKFKKFGVKSEFRPFAMAINPSNISIGDSVIIRPGVALFATHSPGGYIIIEDHIGIGGGCHFYVSNHRFEDVTKPIKYQGHHQAKPIKVCTGSWIGANCSILPGVTIGQNAVVGAGSVVTKDVEAFTVVAGNPAKIIKRLK